MPQRYLALHGTFDHNPLPCPSAAAGPLGSPVGPSGKRIDVVEDSAYYASYARLGIHEEMLADRVHQFKNQFTPVHTNGVGVRVNPKPIHTFHSRRSFTTYYASYARLGIHEEMLADRVHEFKNKSIYSH